MGNANIMGAHVLPLSTTCSNVQHTWLQRPTSPKRQKKEPPPPPKAAPPPPPKAPPPLHIKLKKTSVSERLGVRFLAEQAGSAGAVVDSVEPYGPAWRAKLRAGDTVTHISASGRETEIDSGFRAAEVLRVLQGSFVLRVRRDRI